MRAFERRQLSVAGAFIPQFFAAGAAHQFDFSQEHVELGDIDQMVKLAHVRLCHSRAFFWSLILGSDNYAGDYLTTARNIVLVGGTGTGKSHLATALARHAILEG
jgi:hypothetical protein